MVVDRTPQPLSNFKIKKTRIPIIQLLMMFNDYFLPRLFNLHCTNVNKQ